MMQAWADYCDQIIETKDAAAKDAASNVRNINTARRKRRAGL